MGAVLNEILRPVTGSRSGERPRIVSTGGNGVPTPMAAPFAAIPPSFLAGDAELGLGSLGTESSPDSLPPGGDDGDWGSSGKGAN